MHASSPSIRRATMRIAAGALIVAVGWPSLAGAQKRCRGGKQLYAGQCLYPEEIRRRQAQAARERAAVEARRQAEAERQAAAERAAQDREACEQARRVATVEAWREYVSAHPEGACRPEALERIDELERQAAPPPAIEPVAPPAEPSPGAAHDRAPQAEGGGVSPLAFVGFGLAGAGLLTWGIAGGISLANRSSLSDDCPDDVCTPEQQDTIDSGEAAGHAATVGLIVGGVGAALGVVGLMLPSGESSPEQASASQLALSIGPGQLRLEGRF